MASTTEGLSDATVRSALDAAPDGMLISDAAGTILFTNRELDRLFGYGPGELIGCPVECLLPEALRARHTVHREHFMRERTVRPMGTGMRLQGRHREGREICVEVSLTPLSSPQGDVLVGAAIRAVNVRDSVTAGLARDLRQPLQSLALLNGLLHRVVQDPGAREALQQQDRAITALADQLDALVAGATGPAQAATRPRPSRSTSQRAEDLLLVEDDGLVRRATRLLLTVEGYAVLTASSLDEALDQARGHRELRLVVTDYHLRDGETGLDVLQALQGLLGQELRAVLMSGDTSPLLESMPRKPTLRVARKPVAADALLGMLRELRQSLSAGMGA